MCAPFSQYRLLKNPRLLRCTHRLSLRRTQKYASFFTISHALHAGIFEQPAKHDFIVTCINTTLVEQQIRGVILLVAAVQL